MNFGDPMFVLAIIAMSTVGWVVTTAIRARHGYPVTDDNGRTISKTDPAAAESMRGLTTENDQLKQTVGRLEERLKVLERIATDPARQISEQIEELR